MGAPRLYRIGRAASVSLIVAVLVATCGSCAPLGQERHVEHCAIMPDTVGLYVDNPVTQMGVPVGKVTTTTPEKLDVRADFTVNAQRIRAATAFHWSSRSTAMNDKTTLTVAIPAVGQTAYFRLRRTNANMRIASSRSSTRVIRP